MAWVLVYPFTVRLISYGWARASNEVSRLAIEIENRFAPHPRLTVDAVQRWIEGKTILSDPLELQRSSQTESDPWGNPFRVVERRGNGNRRFAVYSSGRDGMSKTNGNDPDDINSWSDEPVVFYQREAQRDSQMYRFRCTVPWGCILYVPMFFLLRTRKKIEHIRA